MNKKLLAIAVAGTFLAPAAALAQSSVTISGKVMASFGQYKVSGRPAGALGSSSETQVRDESSRILFSMREDLGGGLAAIGRFELRFLTSDGGVGGNSGASFVGLTSPTWGTISLGQFEFHAGESGSFTGRHGGSQTNPTAIMDVARAGTVSIANQTRINNAVRYSSPKWGDMFEVVVGYSANPTSVSNVPVIAATSATNPTATLTVANQNENDLRSTVRKGSAWNIAPRLYGKNWEVAYSYWQAKPDVGLNTLTTSAAGVTSVTTPGSVQKHRGDTLYGWYQWGGLRAGLAYNKSKVMSTALTFAAATGNVEGATTTLSERTAWGIPASYNWGKHTIYMNYNKANGDKAALTAAQIAAGGDTKARLFGLTYAYDLSKRTSAAVSYVGIKNGNAATYNLDSGNAGLAMGEDPSSVHVTLQHRY